MQVITISSVQSLLSIFTYIVSFDVHKHLRGREMKEVGIKEITGLAQGHTAITSKDQRPLPSTIS